ncbi:hypothetical protein UF64_02005 [Thalassospira sp. HJ]|nr:hypothetical protein UF64_02005 [Thalassospira sp. HJ]
MCKRAMFRAESAFDLGKSHKQLDLGGIDAFYGPKSGAFCQNRLETRLVFALRHQTFGPPAINGIQARR